jgi:hypothetical protein
MRTPPKQKALDGHDVPGRLDQPTQIKPFADIEPEQGPSELGSPEHLLWLAVIDRAIADYVKRPPGLSIKYRQGLDWFFFEEDAEPFNLQYLCQQLFDDDSTAVVIRKRVLRLNNQDDKEIQEYYRKRYTLRVSSKYY